MRRSVRVSKSSFSSFLSKSSNRMHKGFDGSVGFDGFYSLTDRSLGVL